MKVTLKRPVFLTILCIVGYVWVVLTIPSIFSPDTKRLGEWFPALFGAVVAFQFISMIGLWHMKRWGVEMFLFNFFFKTVLHLSAGMLDEGGVILGIIVSLVYVFPLMSYYRQMDRNL